MTKIAESVFENCKSIKEAVIHGNIEEIDTQAFSGCDSLERVTLCDGLCTVGSRAFALCPSLKELTIPATVTEISYGAFKGSTSLTKLVIPSEVTDIPSWCFEDCTALTDLILPRDPDQVSQEAFSNIHGTLKRILCSVETAKRLPFSLMSKTAPAFLDRWSSGTASEDEIGEWVDLIKSETQPSLDAMVDNVPFCKFIIQNNIPSPEQVNEMITAASSLECRGLLLEYKHNSAVATLE